ncbi:hypothetical protein [Nonomuraea rubra]|uniref:hypothetical protein n=1 Tax=Nonomuraea rubra TaxID=46180 RepID=UPI0031ECF03C
MRQTRWHVQRGARRRWAYAAMTKAAVSIEYALIKASTTRSGGPTCSSKLVKNKSCT